MDPDHDTLAAAVNARQEQRKAANRWWWLTDWREWVRGAAAGLMAMIFPVVLVFGPQWFGTAPMRNLKLVLGLTGFVAVAGVVQCIVRLRKK